MILQSLVDYYEQLAERGLAERPGWSKTKISYALALTPDGSLVRVVPLSSPSPDGKKMVPRMIQLPAPVRRTVGIMPNFLWDNSSYLLGFDGKNNPQRARDCFASAGELHALLLKDADSPFASAIRNFFASWDPEHGETHPALTEFCDDIRKGGNLVFSLDGRFPAEDGALCRAWQTHYDGAADGEKMRCLVTGQETVPEKVHPAIKNVWGAQSSGASLVGFNAPADCSYEKEQNFNAPVGKYAAFAYTTALNLLLADKDHVRRFGDTTVVYWADQGESVYQAAFSDFLDGGDKMTDSDLMACMDALALGKPHDFGGVQLQSDKPFYILGLAPNAARLSVRFFLRNSFGAFAANLEKHYQDITVVTDNRSKWEAIPLRALLRETVNQNSQNKDASPQMAGDALRAILSGGRYPATLYQQTQLRIRAEHEVTRGRAGIIKAYLTRLQNNERYREALTVELNEQTTYQPYVLGRLFSVLEGLQQRAIPNINTTIKDKYFTSACSTPALVFPTLLNLAQKHLRKLSEGERIYFSNQLTDLTGRITETYPAHHSLYDQGVFQLGYYHQTQKRYEKKDKPASSEENKEENNHD